LLHSHAGSDTSIWCIVDRQGSISHVTGGLTDLLSLGENDIKSLFQFNPEWSFIKWQQVFDSLSTSKSDILESKYLSQNNTVVDCKVKLVQFELQSEKYVQYIILIDEPEVETTASITTSPSIIEATTKTTHFDYDREAPNPVLYFDDTGLITYVNPLMEQLNDPTTQKISVDELFLESELGPLLPALQQYPTKDKEVLVRMILRGSKKMVDGYARMSFNNSKNAPGQYRLEFLLTEGMQLVDQPLEKAMKELDRLRNEVEDSNSYLLEQQLDNFSFENIVTRSPRYKAVLRQVAQVADTETTVLITGETGTGKELLCNATYKLSDRSDKIIVKVNCASIPTELIESILFGHEKGSFTGADSQKIGKFEMANGGTIFLDEIGEMPLELQPKLLRVLQEGEIERIGNPKPIKVDVRVIAATNRDLEKMSKEGKFRSDLYYRLNVFPIYNIPLRDRLEDVPILINHFISKVNSKTGREVTSLRNKDLVTLQNYHYPGNVRELENIIERSIILAEDDELNLSFFYQTDQQGTSSTGGFYSYDEMIKKHLVDALEFSKGKVTGDDSAASLLGLNGKTLASKLKKYNIDPKVYKRK